MSKWQKVNVESLRLFPIYFNSPQTSPEFPSVPQNVALRCLIPTHPPSQPITIISAGGNNWDTNRVSGVKRYVGQVGKRVEHLLLPCVCVEVHSLYQLVWVRPSWLETSNNSAASYVTPQGRIPAARGIVLKGTLMFADLLLYYGVAGRAWSQRALGTTALSNQAG
ncbi:hypothetical protein HZ326_25247 [Fusarium oxysporum f. sp. albedinis]|nr:hypothetical protein HZ326_25247 [Fusarium oxysporum f. sp. albedinis]